MPSVSTNNAGPGRAFHAVEALTRELYNVVWLVAVFVGASDHTIKAIYGHVVDAFGVAVEDLSGCVNKHLIVAKKFVAVGFGAGNLLQLRVLCACADVCREATTAEGSLMISAG